MLEKIKNTASFLKKNIEIKPEYGIVLGTGLGNLVEEIKIEKTFEYSNIPNFPVSTVEGHSGNLIFGTLGGKQIVAMQGRFHYYEGYSMEQIVFPIRVLKFLGISHLFVSNAAGGLNPEFTIGDLMLITDHINLFGDHPLRGKNYDELGPRFPDMSHVYRKELIAEAKKIGEKHGINLQQGVYVGLSGPTYETPAEYKYVRLIGGDAVGMSTVPEIIAAHHAGLKCFAVSVITDSGVPDEIVEISHTVVQEAAKQAKPKLTILFRELIESL